MAATSGESRVVVYHSLYSVPLSERFNVTWVNKLRRQILAMRRALSFMLSPCVEKILSFMVLDDVNVYVCLVLQRRGIPATVRNRVVGFLDDPFELRRAIRALVLKVYWDDYVGRPSDHQGSPLHWQRVCQEVADYQFAHSRCVDGFVVGSLPSSPRLRVLSFREQLDIFTGAS